MVKFAVIADIHGNSDALAAVFADMDALGVTEAVNLGDHFSGPLDASETARNLLLRGYPSISGNHDRWLVEKTPADMGPSDRAAYAQLRPEQLDWLRALPATLLVYGEVFLCHGTPTSDLTYWMERVDADGSLRSATIDEIEQQATGVKASLILCGHTHLPRIIRLRDGRVLVNPGSVGCPAYDDETPVYHRVETGTPNASYAIAEKVVAGWSITFRSVSYTSARMVAMATSNGRDDWALALMTGRIR